MSILASNCSVNSKFTKSYLLIMGCRNFKCLFMMLSITVFICFFFLFQFSLKPRYCSYVLSMVLPTSLIKIRFLMFIIYPQSHIALIICPLDSAKGFGDIFQLYYGLKKTRAIREMQVFFKMENRGFGRWLELLLFFTDFRYFGGFSQRCYIIESVSQSFSVLLLYRVVISYLNK